MDVDVIAKPCVDVCGSPGMIGPLISTGPVVDRRDQSKGAVAAVGSEVEP